MRHQRDTAAVGCHSAAACEPSQTAGYPVQCLSHGYDAQWEQPRDKAATPLNAQHQPLEQSANLTKC